MIGLPHELKTRPIAHRALHDLSRGCPENSLAAIEAACEVGYAIEIDVQPSRDGVPMVFHDDMLDRLTGEPGPIRDRDRAELWRLSLLGTGEPVPTLSDVLARVNGRAPLLIEIKDQGGDPTIGTTALVQSTLDVLGTYNGPVALMSFNPFAVRHGSFQRPDLAWGVTTAHGAPLWPQAPEVEAETLGGAIDPRNFGGSFISHGIHDRFAPWLNDIRAAGIDILSWTVRGTSDEAMAREYAINITFEGYRPAVP